jgi:hypothetical protein
MCVPRRTGSPDSVGREPYGIPHGRRPCKTVAGNVAFHYRLQRAQTGGKSTCHRLEKSHLVSGSPKVRSL